MTKEQKYFCEKCNFTVKKVTPTCHNDIPCWKNHKNFIVEIDTINKTMNKTEKIKFITKKAIEANPSILDLE